MSSIEKPKAPPAPTLSRIAAHALVETIDGPVEIVSLLGKIMPVLTRFPDGTLGFRMMREIRVIEENALCLRLTNTDGQTVDVGTDHVFIDIDGNEVKAADLIPGHHLQPSWTYRAGYTIPAAAEYDPAVRGKSWLPAVTIQSIGPAGSGPVLGFSVNQTKRYFLTFGSASRAQI